MAIPHAARTLPLLSLALALGCSGGSDDVTADGGPGSGSDGGGVDAATVDGGGTDGSPGTDAGTDAGIPHGDPITPEDPGPADVHLTVSSFDDVHPISEWIYGTNQPDWDRDTGRITLVRAGGNRWTAYNWENNASNAGSDWYFQNDGFLGGGDTPGGAVSQVVDPAHAAGAAALVTVPIAGYVAADKAGDGDVAGTPDYLNVRFHVSQADKGAALSPTPDTGDDTVYQDEFVHWAESTFDGPVFYSLDNEPDLWDSTHARIRTSQLTYAEITERGATFARAIREQAPDAKIFGPVSYGWQGMIDLQGAPDADGIFLDYYLRGMRDASDDAGARLLDVLDVHWYPEARGGGTRITVDDASAAVAAARMQAPRSLWDPTYTEDSWIATYGTEGPIMLIPWLRERIDGSYPGTRISISEYYYGGGADISGGVAQADALGVFGREDLFAACLWHLGSTDDRFIHGAFALYRDYDGAGGRFGDTSVHAATDDIERSAAYGSVRSAGGDEVLVIAINRSDETLTAAVQVTHWAELGHATVHRIEDGSPTPAPAGELTAAARNAFLYDMPPTSVSLLVLTP